MTSPSVPYLSFSDAAKQVWWYPVVRGLIAVVLGIVVMANPSASVLFLVRVVGIFVVIDGIVGIVDGFRLRSVPDGGSGWRLTLGVLGVLGGAVLLFWPAATVSILTIIVGIWAVVAGVLATIAAMSLRSIPGSGWGWGLFWGLVTLVFGLVLMFSPDSSVAVLAWIIGLYAVLSGVILVIAGFVLRSLGKRAAELGA
jgi:uncharacterized membrane protein HdeD (DUF308 family)